MKDSDVGCTGIEHATTWSNIKELREKSGWGWDATRHVATAPDSAWDELI